MNCDELAGLIDAYVDGELTPAQCSMVAQHLTSCATCLHTVIEREALRARIRQAGGHLPPASLSARLSRALDNAPDLRGRSKTPWYRSWRLLGSHAAAAALGAFALFLWTSYPVERTAAGDVLAAHLRGLAAEQFTAVTSGESHTVKPWFAGKIDFSPPVADLSAAGFPLLGGRVDNISGHPTAALAYGRRLHRITLFILPAKAAPSGVTADSQAGYQLVQWQDATFAYWAVSDLNRGELAEFGERFRAATEPPTSAP